MGCAYEGRLGGNVETVELSTVELGIGILSSCLPAYRPLYNRIFLGQATANVSNPRSKYHGPSSGSSSHGGIRMVGLRGNSGRQNLGSQDDDEERLYNGRDVTSVRAADDHMDKEIVREAKGIGITRQFGTSTTVASNV